MVLVCVHVCEHIHQPCGKPRRHTLGDRDTWQPGTSAQWEPGVTQPFSQDQAPKFQTALSGQLSLGSCLRVSLRAHLTTEPWWCSISRQEHRADEASSPQSGQEAKRKRSSWGLNISFKDSTSVTHLPSTRSCF